MTGGDVIRFFPGRRGAAEPAGPLCPDRCRKAGCRCHTQTCMIRETVLKLSNIYSISCLRFH